MEIQELILKDVIERKTNNNSLLKSHKQLSQHYHIWNMLNRVSNVSLAISLYYLINKFHTGRIIYSVSVLGNVGFKYITKHYRQAKYEICYKTFNCQNDEDFKDKIFLYRTAVLDKHHYYEKPSRY